MKNLYKFIFVIIAFNVWSRRVNGSKYVHWMTFGPVPQTQIMYNLLTYELHNHNRLTELWQRSCYETRVTFFKCFHDANSTQYRGLRATVTKQPTFLFFFRAQNKYPKQGKLLLFTNTVIHVDRIEYDVTRLKYLNYQMACACVCVCACAVEMLGMLRAACFVDVRICTVCPPRWRLFIPKSGYSIPARKTKNTLLLESQHKLVTKSISFYNTISSVHYYLWCLFLMQNLSTSPPGYQTE